MNSEKVKKIKVKEALETLCYKHKDVGSWQITKLQLMDILTLINELESENEQLKNRIAELEEYIKGNQADAKAFVENWHSDLKKELINFAERLKKKLFDLGNIVNENDIDEALKECLKG